MSDNNEKQVMSFIKPIEEGGREEAIERQMKMIEDAEKQMIRNLKEEARERKQERAENFYHDEDGSRGDKNAFLILITYLNDDSRHWEMCDDRQEAYDFIKSNIEDIDLVESMIVAENCSFLDGISCAKFLVHVIETGKIKDEGFDPMDYIPADYDLSEEE